MNAVLEGVKETAGEVLQLVTFRLGREEYAVDILNVQEINRMVEITNVPNSPPHVEGVINLRGRVIPVVNLRKRFGLDGKEFDRDTRIIVMDIKGTVAGFIVDGVSEVLRISSDTVEPPPPITNGVNSEYVKGVGKVDDRLIILLELERLLSENELAAPTS